MSDASERFLDRLTQSLEGNHELQVHARWKLGEKLKAGSDEGLEQASRRLIRSDQAKGKQLWIVPGLLLLGLGLLGLSACKWITEWRLAKFMFGLGPLVASYEEFVETNQVMASRLPTDDRLLFQGRFDRLRALHPTEPLYFAPGFQDACDSYRRSSGMAPTALIEEVSGIDPDNGWWPYFKANCLSRSLATLTDPSSGAFLGWSSEEQQKIDQILQSYHQAAQAPRFVSYQKEFNSRKIALMPPVKTLHDCASRLVASFSLRDETEAPSFLGQIIATQALKLAENGDVAGFRQLLKDWIVINRHLILNFNPIQDIYQRTNSIHATLPSLLKGSEDLGLHEEAQALRGSIVILDRSMSRPPIPANQSVFRSHGSRLTNQATSTGGDCGLVDDYFHGRYPPITIKRLEPNRRSEQAYVCQLLVLPLGTMLLVASSFLLLFRFRNGWLCRKLSGGLADLFDRSDWIHCLGLGILLPILYSFVIRYLTAFSGNSYFGYIENLKLVLPLLLILSCSLLVFRRRLRARMTVFDTPAAKDWIGVGLTIAGFVVLPLLGSCYRVEQDRFVRLDLNLLYPCLAVMGAMVIWLAVLAFRFLLGNPEQALRRQILSRLLAQAMIWAFALLGATLPLHMLEERFWVKRDTVLRSDPEHPAKTRYEWEAIQQMRGELLEVLAPLDSISR